MRFQVSCLQYGIRRLGQGILLFILAALLTSCGGDDYQDDPAPSEFILSGSGVDGPLSNANVTLYSLLDAAGASVAYATATPGTAVASGTTNAFAQIQDITLIGTLAPPYILEFTSIDATRDLTTGEAPVLSTLRTLITSDMLANELPVYATPLTTIAIDIALANADDSDGVISSTEFQTALTDASSLVKSTLGFGMDTSIDIFTTPPVLNGTSASDEAAEQARIAAYRSAIEAARVIVQQVVALVAADAADGDDVLATLSADLADGLIDGEVSGARAALFATDEVATDALALLQQTPATLCIASDADDTCVKTVADVAALLVEERADTGIDTSDTPDITAPVLQAAELNPDIDGDSVNNDTDAFPEDPEESSDGDADGIGNNSDNCPLVANTSQTDTDSDGIGDDCDTGTIPDTGSDSDGDGVQDSSDNCPSASNADQLNTDSDGQGNACDSDDDGDGLSDTQEATLGTNPLLTDTDSDGDGDNADNCPVVANADQLNSDSDSQGNLCDTDDDNDGTADTADAFPLDASETADTDGDGVGNNDDNCSQVANADQLNTDGDASGNLCDSDDDNDDALDGVDNCPLVSNGDQANFDEDTTGDLCDTDDDNDGLTDAQESALGTSSNDTDSDDDSVGDGTDNCPAIENGDQADTDEDDVGDACDNDADNDGDLDSADNCPADSNPDQLDTDGDTLGNACDPDDDEDGVADDDDLFPTDPLESADTDGDGVGDNTDNCPAISNANQLNSDQDNDPNTDDDDHLGNVCDDNDDFDSLLDEYEISIGTNPLLADTDGDGAWDDNDNCFLVSNPTQADADGDGAGDTCDTDG